MDINRSTVAEVHRLEPPSSRATSSPLASTLPPETRALYHVLCALCPRVIGPWTEKTAKIAKRMLSATPSTVVDVLQAGVRSLPSGPSPTGIVHSAAERLPEVGHG